MNLTNLKNGNDKSKRIKDYMKQLDDAISINSIVEKTTNAATTDYIDPVQPQDNRVKSYAEMAEDELYVRQMLIEKLNTVFSNGRDTDNVINKLNKQTQLFLIQFWDQFKAKMLKGTKYVTPDVFNFIVKKFISDLNFNFDPNYAPGETNPTEDPMALWKNNPLKDVDSDYFNYESKPKVYAKALPVKEEEYVDPKYELSKLVDFNIPTPKAAAAVQNDYDDDSDSDEDGVPDPPQKEESNTAMVNRLRPTLREWKRLSEEDPDGFAQIDLNTMELESIVLNHRVLTNNVTRETTEVAKKLVKYNNILKDLIKHRKQHGGNQVSPEELQQATKSVSAKLNEPNTVLRRDATLKEAYHKVMADSKEKEVKKAKKGKGFKKKIIRGKGFNEKKVTRGRKQFSYIKFGSKLISMDDLKNNVLNVKYPDKKHTPVAKLKKITCSDELKDLIIDMNDNNKINDGLLKHLNENDRMLFNKLMLVCNLEHHISYTNDQYQKDLERYKVLEAELEVNDNPEIKVEMISILNKLYSLGKMNHSKFISYVHAICN